MRKKNVLHILRTYSLHGGERQLSKVLVQNDYFKNIFLDLYFDKKLKEVFSKKKIPYLYLNNFYIKPKGVLFEVFFTFFLMFYNFFKIRKIINSNKIDVVLCHGIQAAILVQILMLFTKKKINFYYMHRILKHKRFYDVLSRSIYKKFKLILCNSNAVKLSLVNFCSNKKIKVIYNAVDFDQNFKFKKKKNIILSVARFEKRKNLLFLLKSFEIFLKNNNQYYLYFIGDGPEKENLLNYVKKKKIKNVKFLGYKNNVKYYLKKSKIFVHTSLFEGMSNSVLEAMSYGIPSVVLNSPGVAELHLHKKTGYVSPQNIEIFSKYIQKIAKNVKLQKIFFNNSRQRVKKEFSIENTVKKYNSYLK